MLERLAPSVLAQLASCPNAVVSAFYGYTSELHNKLNFRTTQDFPVSLIMQLICSAIIPDTRGEPRTPHLNPELQIFPPIGISDVIKLPLTKTEAF